MECLNKLPMWRWQQQQKQEKHFKKPINKEQTLFKHFQKSFRLLLSVFFRLVRQTDIFSRWTDRPGKLRCLPVPNWRSYSTKKAESRRINKKWLFLVNHRGHHRQGREVTPPIAIDVVGVAVEEAEAGLARWTMWLLQKSKSV